MSILGKDKVVYHFEKLNIMCYAFSQGKQVREEIVTAEIAVLNKNAVALAADSAITASLITGKKISTSGNKLFALSYRHPVGIMIYNNTLLMEMPWETIIKTFRKTIPRTGFNTLEEYANKLIAFIETNYDLFPEEMRDRFATSFISAAFINVRSEIDSKVKAQIEKLGKIDDKSIESIVISVIDEFATKWENEKALPSLSIDQCRSVLLKKRPIFDQCVQNMFKNIQIPQDSLNKLFDVAVYNVLKATRNDLNTGVVIAGYGEKEFLPSAISFTVDGIVDVKLMVCIKNTLKIDNYFSNLIIPYAQRDMVELFVRGVDTQYINEQKTKLNKMVNDYASKVVDIINLPEGDAKTKIKNQILDVGTTLQNGYNQSMEAYIQTQFVSSISNVVSLLQKDQLAQLAESLVTLTCQKRQFSTSEETVKPPVDVAVISKGDGFIWIQRKHYFKTELNPQYLSLHHET